MQGPVCKEDYPAIIVLASNLVPLAIYLIGISLLLRFGIVWVAAYLLFVLILEFRLLSGHCTDCHYFGKTCAFGKGRLSSLFFKKGIPERFTAMTITWKDILPDFLVFIIPVLAGIILLIREFSVPILILVISLLLLGFVGNALVRGQLACKYCKQREIGCPAERLFDKTGKS